MTGEALTLRGRLAKLLRERAGERGLSVEEYLVELLAGDLDPGERAREYIEAARGLLEEAREELGRGNVRQAAEKLWGAAALAVRAYAEWREGKRLTSHGELWEYTKRMIDEIGEWVYDAWMTATGMHACFYEAWCTQMHVEEALKRIERLVEEEAGRLGSSAA